MMNNGDENNIALFDCRLHMDIYLILNIVDWQRVTNELWTRQFKKATRNNWNTDIHLSAS